MTIDRLNADSPPSPLPVEPSASWPQVQSEEFLPAIYPWNLFGWLLLLITLATGVLLVTVISVSVTSEPTIAPPHSTK